MKKTLMVILLVLFAFVSHSGNYEKLEKLKEEKRKIAMLVHKKRVELIKNTPSLKELQKKIIALHKELAIRIDNNSAMRELIKKEKNIDSQIKKMEQ